MGISRVIRRTLLQFLSLTLGLWVTISFSNRTLAQSTDTTASYRSSTDDLLTVQKVSVFPFTDNLQGIYARPLEAHFISLIQGYHRFDYVPANSSGPVLAPEELESSVDKTLQVSQGLGADAFFVVRITKGPNGVMMHMSAFLTKDGKLLSQAILKDYKQFDIESLKEQLGRLLKEVIARLPYSGRVLSRDGNRVTVNLGLRDGIQPGQLLSVIQIVQAQRHPKFNFLIKTEKEIFGRVKVLKVDETLSFGVVISEREKGAIQKNAKIGNIEFVSYGSAGDLSLNPSAEEALTNREDNQMVFGKDAKPWQPTNPPKFGQIGGLLGLSRFNGNRESTGVGSADGSNNFAPSLTLIGDLWVTEEWTFHARLRQAIIPIDNPVSGSTPSDLNQSLSYYEAGLGYTVRLGPHLWSPMIEPYLSLFYYRLYVDDTTPRVFTTTQYSGIKFGLRGSTPVGLGGEYGVGGDFAMTWKPTPTVKESPSPSGDSAEPSVVQFGIFGYKRLGERMKVQAALDFEMFSATFSGASGANGATSVSHRHTTLSGGLVYMF